MKFRSKYILVTLLFQASVLAIVIISSLVFLITSTERVMRSHIASSGKSFAHMVTDAVISSDLASLEEIAKKVASYDGIGYVSIVDESDKIMAAAGDPGVLEDLDSIKKWFGLGSRNKVIEVTTSVDLAGISFGKVNVYFLTDDVEEFITFTAQYFVVFALIAILVTAILSFLFGSYLSNRWSAIRDASERVAEGDFGILIPVTGSDEIAQTATSFNQMSKDLDELYLSLAEREERVKAIIENIIDGLITIDERGTIFSVNPAAKNLFQYDETEMIGNNVKMLMPGHIGKHHDQFLKNYIDTGERKIIGSSREVEGLRKDGSKFPLELSISEMYVEGKRYFLGITRDISERKTAEYEMQRSKGILEIQAAELRDLAERYAAESERAKQSAKAKSEFLANMSHEIRTPMNAIIGLSHLALQASPPPKQEDYLKKIRVSGQNLLHIINDILELSKIDAGKVDLEYQPFRVADIAENIRILFRDLAKSKGLKLTIDESADMPKAFCGDLLRINQIVTNLVSNAIKFTHAGEVTVSIGMRKDIEPRTRSVLQISVFDTGIGLTQEQIGSLFKDFTQADGSTTRKYGGTGLGLVISKRFAELMGGEINVESNIGDGSCFRVFIPLDDASAEEVQSELHTGDVDSLAFKGARILVVEDNEINRQIAKELLTRSGAVVTLVNDGIESLDYLEKAEQLPHIILMDLQMPNMDGFEASKNIQLRYGDKAPPILAMTAHAFDEERDRCLRAGMKAHISKPIDISELFSVLSAFYVAGTDDGTLPLAVKEGEIPTQLVGLTSFDIPLGLRRMMGHEHTYITLLQQFGKHYQAARGVVRTHILEGDRSAAQAQTHLIRGAAGNLSAVNLHEAASALDIALSNSDEENLADLVDRYEEALDLTLIELDSIQLVTDAQDDAVLVLDPKAEESYNALMRALKNNDFKAKSSVKLFLKMLPISKDDSEAWALRTAVDKLDFEAAQVHLNKLAKHFDLNHKGRDK